MDVSKIKMENGVPIDAFKDGKAKIVRQDQRKKRRDVLNACADDWSLDFKMNVMCPLKMDIPDVRKEIVEAMKGWKFREYSIINVGEWPECEATEKVKPFFDVFKDYTRNRLIFYNDPHETVFPHVDPIRGFVVYFPLWPLGNDYSPMEFYYKNDFYGLPKNDKPLLYAFNPQNIHCVFNNEFHRYNMQISLDISYQDAVEKWKHLFDF